MFTTFFQAYLKVNKSQDEQYNAMIQCHLLLIKKKALEVLIFKIHR